MENLTFYPWEPVAYRDPRNNSSTIKGMRASVEYKKTRYDVVKIQGKVFYLVNGILLDKPRSLHLEIENRFKTGV